MTEHFEVVARDGPARRAELRLDDPVTTPALVDDRLVDGGSLWPAERPLPDGDPDRLTILPHRGFPTGTREPVQEAFEPAVPDVACPAAAVVTPHLAADLGVDAYVLSGLGGLVGDARRLTAAIVATREAIPPDAGLYAPGIATPASAPWLCWAGVDLLDRDRAVVEGTRGRYLTPEGSTPTDELEELPCRCRACADADAAALGADDVIDHNVATLEATVARVREAIRTGGLREYLEGQVRHTPWLTAALRVLDERWAYLEERTPILRRRSMAATTEDALLRVEVRRFAARVTERLRPRLNDRPAVLVPCSATKPYSESPSHGRFRDAMGYRGHLVSLSSPLAVVPEELELTYPAQHYDAAVTGRWSEAEVAFVADVLATYLERSGHPTVVAHVPADGYRPAVERACDRAGVDDVAFTVEGHPTDEAALAGLAAALEGYDQLSRARRHMAILRGIADYQFGEGVGDGLLRHGTVTGRYPRLRVEDGTGEQLATLVRQYGVIALTLAGARRLRDATDDGHRVSIDGFVPHGSVLAPGVVDASGGIRVGDEVLVEGPRAFGVGRAAMSGPEMVGSDRGIAVDVRHVEER